MTNNTAAQELNMTTENTPAPAILFHVGVASEGGYIADGTCVLCKGCLARRKAENDFEHHLGADAAVLIDDTDALETDTDECDVCEDCDAPNIVGA